MYDSPLEFSKIYMKKLLAILERIGHQEVAVAIALIEQAVLERKKIFFLGNGGSVATCSHFVCDMIGISARSGIHIDAINLAENASAITAIANDFGYENIFTHQLKHLLAPGDVLVAISASGNSRNLLNAVEFAKSKGNSCIGIIGFDGGLLKCLSDVVIFVESAHGEYGAVEDAHLVIAHIITDYFKGKLLQLSQFATSLQSKQSNEVEVHGRVSLGNR
ncbi:MAG: SIS domain-containing protein [Oligoflexia bacterium]|nr:SIS domain-containing protein [Oligoflexia bacterium]